MRTNLRGSKSKCLKWLMRAGRRQEAEPKEVGASEPGTGMVGIEKLDQTVK